MIILSLKLMYFNKKFLLLTFNLGRFNLGRKNRYFNHVKLSQGIVWIKATSLYLKCRHQESGPALPEGCGLLLTGTTSTY